MKSFFRFLARRDAEAEAQPAAVPEAMDAPDFDAVVTYTSPARSGESRVISTKLMNAEMSILRGMTAPLAGSDEALNDFTHAGDLLLDYRGPIDQHSLDTLVSGAARLAEVGDNARSIALFERAVEAAEHDRGLACDRLGDELIRVGLLLGLGALPRVRGIAERLLASHRDRHGARHERTGAILYLIAGLVELGDVARSGGLYREVADLRQAVLGEEHADTLKVYDAVARSCLQAGETDEGIEWAERARAVRERVLGPNDVSIAESLEIVGMGLKRKGDLRSAEVMLRRALAIVQAAGSEEEAKSGILLAISRRFC